MEIMIDTQIEQYFESNLSQNLKPKPPKPPLSRIVREGSTHLCPNCGSSMIKNGWLKLFGTRLCINKDCIYSDEIFVDLENLRIFINKLQLT